MRYSGMLKVGVTLFVFVFHSSIRLVDAVDCQATDMAQFQLESYYTWWYRLTNLYTKTNPLCSLDDEKRKKLCAEVAKACYTELDAVEIENVLQVVDTPTECEKRTFTTPLLKNSQTFWSRKKRMFACKQFTVAGIRPVAEFYLSAAGIENAVTVFHRPSEKSPIITLIRLVTGLSYQGKQSKEPRGQTEPKEKEPQGQTEVKKREPRGQTEPKEKEPQGQTEAKKKEPQGQTEAKEKDVQKN